LQWSGASTVGEKIQKQKNILDFFAKNITECRTHVRHALPNQTFDFYLYFLAKSLVIYATSGKIKEESTEPDIMETL